MKRNGYGRKGDHYGLCVADVPSCKCNTCKNDNAHGDGVVCCIKHDDFKDEVCGDCIMKNCPDYKQEVE